MQVHPHAKWANAPTETSVQIMAGMTRTVLTKFAKRNDHITGDTTTLDNKPVTLNDASDIFATTQGKALIFPPREEGTGQTTHTIRLEPSTLVACALAPGATVILRTICESRECSISGDGASRTTQRTNASSWVSVAVRMPT